jgi:thiamine kinase-like enzyme
MRSRFKPTPEQRAALREQLARLQQPAAALQLLRPLLPDDFVPADVQVTLQSAHPDRFVVRAECRSVDGATAAYALKAYCDDFVHQVWNYSRALALLHRPNHRGLCLPIRYIPEERIIASPWVQGQFLSDIQDERRPELLRQAALLAADVHRLRIVPEPPTSAQMFVADSLARCERLRAKWPDAGALIQPLMGTLERAAACLEPAEPGPIHGDMSPGQFLWTGDRLVLLDLDMFGYADPAYDVGHFLAQMERRSVMDLTARPLTDSWLSCFEEAYLTAMPHVSPRNVAFYRGLTLVRKMYTLCRRQPTDWQGPVSLLAWRACTALEDVLAAAERARLTAPQPA